MSLTTMVSRYVSVRRQRAHQQLLEAYPVIDPRLYLGRGEHMRLRGCACTWAHLDDALLSMSRASLQSGRGAAWFDGCSSPIKPLRMLACCQEVGHASACRLVQAEGRYHGLHGLPQSWSSHTIRRDYAALERVCPGITSDSPDVVLGSPGLQASYWGLPAMCGSQASAEGARLVEGTMQAILAEVGRGRDMGHRSPLVVLSYCTEGAAAVGLPAFLDSMKALDTGVVVAERVACTEPLDPRADDCFALDLEGACWSRRGQSARGASTLLSPPGLEDTRRWDAGAFLVKQGTLGLPAGVEFRFEPVAWLEGEPMTRAGRLMDDMLATMTLVGPDAGVVHL